uniref:Uncharacterized protein n=1 Tax=Leersia perrieri TaxID=77586 RepID=A0A0D9X4A3_9ORYZ
MEKATVFVMLLTAAVIAGVAAAGCDDYDVPSMSPAAACQKASTGPSMAKLCNDRLGAASSPEQEVTAFVLAAANAASASYGATGELLMAASQDAAATKESRAAASTCVEKYGEAMDRVAAAVAHLNGCELAELVVDVLPAVVAVDDCGTALLSAGDQGSPLYGMVMADRDRSMLVLRLRQPGN